MFDLRNVCCELSFSLWENSWHAPAVQINDTDPVLGNHGQRWRCIMLETTIFGCSLFRDFSLQVYSRRKIMHEVRVVVPLF